MFMTFEEWLDMMIERNSNALLHNAIVPCPRCSGKADKKCHICRGTGEVLFANLVNQNKEECFSKMEYLAYLYNDIEFCLAHDGLDFSSENPCDGVDFYANTIDLSDNGYACASLLTGFSRRPISLIVNLETNVGFDENGMSYKL